MFTINFNPIKYKSLKLIIVIVEISKIDCRYNCFNIINDVNTISNYLTLSVFFVFN